MAKVSIMFPSFNHESYVEEAINSIYNQTYTDYEIIISDDASTDGTYEIITKICNKKAKLHRFESNVGASMNTKYCYDLCDSKYIALLNSDDVWDSKHLEKSVEYLDMHSDCAAVFSWAAFIDEDSQIIDDNVLLFKQNNRTKEEWFRHLFTYGNCLCHPSMVIRKTAYEDIGFYSMSLRQLPDYDEWIRLVKKYEIHVIPEVLVKHRRCNKELTNTSSPTITNSIRDINEQLFILMHYFDDISDDYFKKSFGSMFIKKDASTYEELLCEKFFILKNDEFHLKGLSKIVAFIFFNEIYSIPSVKQTFDQKYAYSISDFHEFGASIDLLGVGRTEMTISSVTTSPDTFKDRLRYCAYALFGKDTKKYNKVLLFFRK